LSHDAPEGGDEHCRFCQIRRIVGRASQQVRPRRDRSHLKVAVGLAVPAIEAWYLVGKNHQVGEAAWKVGLDSGRPPFTRQNLKQLVYGTDRPSLEFETECAIAETRRIIHDLRAIEQVFPVGFGLMAREIRAWKA
jgi:hypothetical protein